MTSFEYLLMGHLVGDFLLQTNWMAKNKASNLVALIIHSFVYTLVIFVTAQVFIPTFTIWASLLIFVAHCMLDYRQLTLWWLRQVMQVPKGEDQWIIFVVDQIFHLLVLVSILHLK